jgi:23S rRNA pseudouridine1911/1915/1917 synthase
MGEPFNEAEADKKVLTAGEDADGRLDAWLAAALPSGFSPKRAITR